MKEFTEKMGLFDRLAALLGLRKKEVNVLVVGLNNSGKSTVINNFKREDDRCIDIVPTVGFNVEKFACKLNSVVRRNVKNVKLIAFSITFICPLLHLRNIKCGAPFIFLHNVPFVLLKNILLQKTQNKLIMK